MGALRVVLADDEALFRESLAEGLAGLGVEVVGQAGTADELLELIAVVDPDVAVVDIRMPPTKTTEGLEAAVEVRRRWPGTGVLLLSHDIQTRHLTQLLSEGAAGLGYLLKERVVSLKRFRDDLARVAEGGSVLDQEVVARMMQARLARDRLKDLTNRENEVLALMAEGCSNPAIAAKMSLKPKTVEIHIGRVFEKLGLEVGSSTETDRRVMAVLAYLTNR